jgi:hypothetical protein
MNVKFEKLLLFPVFGLIALTISCNPTSEPTPVATYGCMDKQALNYNRYATIDDKSCYYVATAATSSNSLIEFYTGVRAKYGPSGMTMAQNIQNNNPQNVVIVAIHTGAYATSKTGWPDYTSAYGDSIAIKAGMTQPVTSYPGGSVNRYHFSDVTSVATYKMVPGDAYTVLFKEGFLLASNNFNARTSPVNIGIATYWTESSRTLKVTVEYYYTSAETDPNYLNVALLENGLVGKQLSGNDTLTDYVQNHVLRTFLTGQWGGLLTTTVGTRIKKSYEYKVPASIKIENCDVAAYISRDIGGNKVYVLTAKQTKAKN